MDARDLRTPVQRPSKKEPPEKLVIYDEQPARYGYGYDYGDGETRSKNARRPPAPEQTSKAKNFDSLDVDFGDGRRGDRRPPRRLPEKPKNFDSLDVDFGDGRRSDRRPPRRLPEKPKNFDSLDVDFGDGRRGDRRPPRRRPEKPKNFDSLDVDFGNGSQRSRRKIEDIVNAMNVIVADPYAKSNALIEGISQRSDDDFDYGSPSEDEEEEESVVLTEEEEEEDEEEEYEASIASTDDSMISPRQDSEPTAARQPLPQAAQQMFDFQNNARNHIESRPTVTPRWMKVILLGANSVLPANELVVPAAKRSDIGKTATADERAIIAAVLLRNADAGKPAFGAASAKKSRAEAIRDAMDGRDYVDSLLAREELAIINREEELSETNRLDGQVVIQVIASIYRAIADTVAQAVALQLRPAAARATPFNLEGIFAYLQSDDCPYDLLYNVGVSTGHLVRWERADRKKYYAKQIEAFQKAYYNSLLVIAAFLFSPNYQNSMNSYYNVVYNGGPYSSMNRAAWLSSNKRLSDGSRLAGVSVVRRKI